MSVSVLQDIDLGLNVFVSMHVRVCRGLLLCCQCFYWLCLSNVGSCKLHMSYSTDMFVFVSKIEYVHHNLQHYCCCRFVAFGRGLFVVLIMIAAIVLLCF